MATGRQGVNRDAVLGALRALRKKHSKSALDALLSDDEEETEDELEEETAATDEEG